MCCTVPHTVDSVWHGLIQCRSFFMSNRFKYPGRLLSINIDSNRLMSVLSIRIDQYN